MKSIKTKAAAKRKINKVNYSKFFLITGILLSGLSMYIVYRISTSDKTLISLSFLPLVAGLLFEFKKNVQKWPAIIKTVLASFALSFTAFLPGEGESKYIFEDHIRMWPFSFLMFFILIAIFFYEKEITKQLTEGITLLQSLAFIYWGLDQDFWNTEYTIVKVLIAIGLLFALFAFVNAFTNIVLSQTARFLLSMWSSVVMLLFAFDNIIRVYLSERLETVVSMSSGIYLILQYFLLGASSIYIVHNFLMFFGFFPGKGSFFNKQYLEDLKELKLEFINRYSDVQIKITDALLCTIIVGTIFGLNYYYNFVPRNFIIWLVFISFPYVLYMYYRLTKK